MTNPNLVSRINPYSHVIVYVGPRLDRNGEHVLDKEGERIHDVVHVAKSNWRGIVVAGISKVDINSVVKPNDKVFLGHKLKACQPKDCRESHRLRGKTQIALCVRPQVIEMSMVLFVGNVAQVKL